MQSQSGRDETDERLGVVDVGDRETTGGCEDRDPRWAEAAMRQLTASRRQRRGPGCTLRNCAHRCEPRDGFVSNVANGRDIRPHGLRALAGFMLSQRSSAGLPQPMSLAALRETSERNVLHRSCVEAARESGVMHDLATADVDSMT